ncbi:MAG: hypothetical protein ABIF01_03845 [Candidatus Micrarchaeota archaeon]
MSEKTVVAKVYDALDEDLYLRSAIRLGIANLSAVSERLRKEAAPNASVEAVRAAVRRYVSDMGDEETDINLTRLLSNTGFSLRSNISVIQAYQDKRVMMRLDDTLQKIGKEFNIISSGHAITVIAGDESVQEVVKAIGKENLIGYRRGLHAIYLNSGKEIKTTRGFVAFVTSLLHRKGINLIEFYSCYTDTVLIVSREDSLKAYELLDRIVGKRKGIHAGD